MTSYLAGGVVAMNVYIRLEVDWGQWAVGFVSWSDGGFYGWLHILLGPLSIDVYRFRHGSD